ncbi:haloacetate dehalogenase [Dietzia sp. 2505]|uniref:alpha/beta fold hydrolase n=1 Tax=Dietzia sp. 2505 TaxID=3156457 RepID=UPI0033969243
MTDGPEHFPGFHSRVIETPGARIRVRVGGSGPLVVLLHGYPQTGAMWHRIAARLATRHTVAVPDLRGYGASECSDEDFSFRAMAADVAALIGELGGDGSGPAGEGDHGDHGENDDDAIVIGHDRGARTAHRLVLDRPALVRGVALLDILPTTEVWRLMSPEMIRSYYHWGFLARPEIAEPMIADDPVRFLHSALAGLYSPLEAFHPQALAEYEQAICRPGVIHAICGDYQAGATVDLAHDEADLHRRPDLPALVLWGARGKVGAEVDPLEVWRGRLPRAEGRAIDAGHYLVEEAPEETWAAIAGFLERI